MRFLPLVRPRPVAVLASAALALAACTNTDVGLGPTTTPELLTFSAAQIKSLDSTGTVIVQANPGNGDLKSLVDSALMVLTAGVQAKRVNITTDLTTVPLYMVGIHRAVSNVNGSFSTWTLVAIDDPNNLKNLIEVAGFAQSTGSTPPSSVSGTIGSVGNIGNGMLLQVAAGGAVTQWRPNAGTASFSSDAPGAACPGFTPTPKVTCALETMHVRFTETAASGSGGASGRQATLSADTDVPAMRLTYTP